jgi:hypothetical protein
VRFPQTPEPYGQPEEETPAEDEQAQAPQALEIAPPPKAHVAEIGAGFRAAASGENLTRRPDCGGFLLGGYRDRFEAGLASTAGAITFTLGSAPSMVPKRWLGVGSATPKRRG